MLYSNNKCVFDQSEHTQGPIDIINRIIIARFILNTVGTELFCYVKVEDFASHLIPYYCKKSFSVSDKASDIIFQRDTGYVTRQN